MVVLSELPEIDLSGTREPDQKNWWDSSSQQWASFLRNREEQVFLVLTLLIGAIVGMAVVAFILLTERFAARLYPAGGTAWRRLFVPIAGSAVMGYFLYRFFPNGRRTACAGAWGGGRGLGGVLGGSASAAGTCFGVRGAGGSRGGCRWGRHLGGTRSCGRIRLGGVHEAPALDAGALSAISEKNGVV